MQHEEPSNERTDTARADLRKAIMASFCSVLHGTQLPPMQVMMLAAEAIGAIYKEVADAHHRGHNCPCGWQPSPAADIEALQAALAMTARAIPNLRLVPAAGNA